MKYLNQLLPTIVVFISRFGMLPANFSPLGAYGFWGGNLFFYFSSIVIFDYFKGGFYKGFLFTYIGFFIYFLLGKLAINNFKRQALFLPLSSFLFFLISNFGVWYYWYPHTFDGLLRCYLVAVPFYRNTLLGDLVFGYGVMVMRLIVSHKYYQEFVKLDLSSWRSALTDR